MLETRQASAPGKKLPERLDALFRAHGSVVWRTLRGLGLNEADAEDLCQEVFVVAHQKLDTFEGRSSIRTWLCGIAVRLAAKHRRRFSTQREIPTDKLPDIESTGGPDEALSASEARALLGAALEKLDPEKREVFVLFEIEELSMNDVAAALDCPLQTAYSRLYAARKVIETHFATLARRERVTEGERR